MSDPSAEYAEVLAKIMHAAVCCPLDSNSPCDGPDGIEWTYARAAAAAEGSAQARLRAFVEWAERESEDVGGGKVLTVEDVKSLLSKVPVIAPGDGDSALELARWLVNIENSRERRTVTLQDLIDRAKSVVSA